MKTKIFAICDDFQRQGIKPTLERVRVALGGGSFSTINPILKEWKGQQGNVVTDIQDLPIEAVQAINHAASIIWSLATSQGTDSMRLLKADFESRLNDAAVERDEALNEVARLEQELTKAIANIEKQDREINSLTLQVQKQQLSLDDVVRQNNDLKADLKIAKAELKEANNDASMLRGQLSVYQSQVVDKSVKKVKPVNG